MADEAVIAATPPGTQSQPSPAASGSAEAPGTSPAATPEVAASGEQPAFSRAPESPDSSAPQETGASESDAGADPVSPLGAAKSGEEAVPEEQAATEAAPEATVDLPSYEPFTLPEGLTADEERIGAFTGMLGTFERAVQADPAALHAAVQKLGQDLVEFHASEAQAARERMEQLQRESWERAKDGWLKEFREDPEIGRNRQTTTLNRVGQVLEQYGRTVGSKQEAAVRQAFDLTGGGYHPDIIRFVNWVADRFVEKARPVPAVVPRSPAASGSRASRLYRNSLPGAA